MPPNGWDQESIWNMKVVGFNDNQGRPSSDDRWIDDENERRVIPVDDVDQRCAIWPHLASLGDWKRCQH